MLTKRTLKKESKGLQRRSATVSKQEEQGPHYEEIALQRPHYEEIPCSAELPCLSHSRT